MTTLPLHCFRCRYPLHQTPDVETCPECGFPRAESERLMTSLMQELPGGSAARLRRVFLMLGTSICITALASPVLVAVGSIGLAAGATGGVIFAALAAILYLTEHALWWTCLMQLSRACGGARFWLVPVLILIHVGLATMLILNFFGAIFGSSEFMTFGLLGGIAVTRAAQLLAALRPVTAVPRVYGHLRLSRTLQAFGYLLLAPCFMIAAACFLLIDFDAFNRNINIDLPGLLLMLGVPLLHLLCLVTGPALLIARTRIPRAVTTPA